MATKRDSFVVLEPGMRIRFHHAGRDRIGVVKRIDETKFPGTVYVEDDHGVVHEVPINFGWAD